MNTNIKLAMTVVVLTLFSVQGYAAGFMKYGEIKGESQAAREDGHKKWINLDSVSMSREQAHLRGDKPKSMQKPVRSRHMGWDNVSPKAGEGDRPTEKVSFYFNKIQMHYWPEKRDFGSNQKPKTRSLLIPAVQKVR